MVETIKQTETAPVSYPPIPGGLSDNAIALDPEPLWQRIESYTTHRWSEREVTWLIEGCGEWRPPLQPVNISNSDVWQDDAWQPVILPPSFLGGLSCRGGRYRITATVGANNPPPPIVLAAYARLAEYSAAERGIAPELTSYRNQVGDVEVQAERSATWIARSIQNSGAADLLRGFRGAG